MRAAAASVALLLLTTSVSAQSGGHIGLYSDNPSFSDCNLAETIGVVSSIYVVHHLIPEVSSSRFRVAHNWHQATVLATDYHTNLASGNIYTGVTVTYPGCEPEPYLVATLQLLPTSFAPPCVVEFYVAPDPAAASGQIETTGCGGPTLSATGGGLTVKGNVIDCGCDRLDDDPPPPWVGTEATTWGHIKSLYR